MNSAQALIAFASTSALGAFVAISAFSAPSGAVVTGNTCTWVGPSGGAWSAPANWSCAPAGAVPGAGDTAVFPLGDGGSSSIVIDGQQAVGAIVVNGENYTFAPSGDAGLTLGAQGTFTAFPGAIDDFTVPLTIGSPVTFSAGASVFGAPPSVQSGPIAFEPGGSLTNQGASVSVTGPLTGPGSLIVSGGEEIVSSAANTYDGGTQVHAGRLTAENPTALGSGPVVVDGDGGLQITGSGSYANALTLGSPSSPILFAQPSFQATLAWAGPIALVGPAQIQAASLVVSGPITSSAPVALTLENEGNGSTPLELSSPNNSYSGATIIAPSPGSGAVVADYASSFGTGPLTILGASAGVNAGVVELAPGVALANPIDAPGGILLANGSASVTGAITGSGYGLGAATNGATLEVSGTLGGSADSSGRGVYIDGPVIVANTGTGTVLLDLASPATYAGQTAIVATTLDLGSQPNPLPPSTQVTFLTPGANFPPGVLAVHAPAAIGSLLGEPTLGAITIDHGAILTIATGDAAQTQYFLGPITGDGGVTFTGSGGSTFPGPQDGGAFPGDFDYAYTGPTRIEGNPPSPPTVLALYTSTSGAPANGSIPSSTVTVAAGGELDLGPGSVVGPVVGAGGTIVPYPGSPATLDAGVSPGVASLTLSASTTVRMVYAGPDGGTSFLAVNGGAVSLGDATLVATSAPSAEPQGPVVVLSNRSDAGVQGTFANLPEGTVFSASGAGLLRISYVGGDGNDVTLEAQGADGGASDSGLVADAGIDATVGSTDGGSFADAAGALDASAADATAPVASADAAPPDAATLEDGALVPVSPPAGGCGCEAAGGGAGDSRGIFLSLAALALVLFRRRPHREPRRGSLV